MQTDMVSVRSADPMQKVQDLFDQCNIRHLPVIDNDIFVGLISYTDLMHFLELIDKDSREFYLNKLRLKNYKVEEVMTREIISAQPNDSIQKVIQLIYDHDFHAVPILDKGKIVGMLTTHDILRFVLKSA